MDDGVYWRSRTKIIENILNEARNQASNAILEHDVTFSVDTFT